VDKGVVFYAVSTNIVSINGEFASLIPPYSRFSCCYNCGNLCRMGEASAHPSEKNCWWVCFASYSL